MTFAVVVGGEQNTLLTHEERTTVGERLALRQQSAILLQPGRQLRLTAAGRTLPTPAATAAAPSPAATGHFDRRQDAPAALVSFVLDELHRRHVVAGGELEGDAGPRR